GSMTSFQWENDPEEALDAAFVQYEGILRDQIIGIAQAIAPEIESWMKENAPWTDRTGNLRASLYAEVLDLVTQIVIIFDYGLDYGRFLEYANQGRFAIIGPALDYWSVRVFEVVGLLQNEDISVGTAQNTFLSAA